MHRHYRSSVKPRNGKVLTVLVVARISGCASQKEVSLDDQVDSAKAEIAELFDGETEFHVISTKGKGEQIDRPELKQVEELIRTNTIDFLIMEDVGRLVRGTEAVRLWGIAVDHGVRCIAPNDCVDTIDDSWEEELISSCRDHVNHNVQTSKRLKKKMTNRFRRYGKSTPLPIAGYIKPNDAESYYDWIVDEAARPIILAAAERLAVELNCTSIADQFNELGFATGPYCRKQEWDGDMVRRYFANPLLKGKPERGNRHTVKHHETGRRISVRNPDGAVSIELPHLVILPEVLFDELNSKLHNRNSCYRRKRGPTGQDLLKSVPRKRTRFPGRLARCWYCGRELVWGGNGIKNHLQCNGSRTWNCWNSIGVSGLRIADLVVTSISDMLFSLDGFDEQLRRLTSEAAQQHRNSSSRLRELRRQQANLERQSENVMAAIREFGPSERLKMEHTSLELAMKELGGEIRRTELSSSQESSFPASIADFRSKVEASFLDLACDSYEFGRLMPQLVPELWVYAVRMIDGGPLLPRIQFTIDLTSAFEQLQVSEEVASALRKTTHANVFDFPKRELTRLDVVSEHEAGKSMKQIAADSEIPICERVVKEAIELNRLMRSRKVSDPLVLQTGPPEDLKKMKKHKHPRYRFKAVEGYQPVPLVS